MKFLLMEEGFKILLLLEEKVILMKEDIKKNMRVKNFLI
jgi:hypothetical protein